MEQQEQVEWDDVNKLLQYHGFKPVCFADPVENKNLSDLVLLGKASAGEIRATLRTMLTDSERRQALIQELIKSNKELKEEAQQQMRAAAHQSQRATELQTLLDQVRVQVQELEERHLDKVLQHGSRMQQLQQLQQEKEEEQKRSEELQLKLWREKEKSAELQRKLYFTIKEEEERRSESGQLHTERRSRHNSAAEELSDVMMVYEAEVTRLKDELRSIRGETDPRPAQRTTNSAASSFHTALKVYEQQQRESRGQIEELKKEVEQLKQELLQTQTTVKEAKLNKHTVCGVDGLKRRSKTRSRDDQLCAHYHNLLTGVSAMVTDPPGAPSGPRRRQRPAAAGPDVTGFDDVLPRLEVWSQQLHLLKELQRRLRRLAARLFPGQLCDGVHGDAGGVKVEDMVLLVDTMLEDISAAADDEKVLRSPTKFTLASMVSHFQKLFDVSSLSGVFPRMNEVYSRLGETSTAMKNLRDVLDLDSRASAAQVVQQTSQLVSSRSKVDELLGDADIDSIIVKVKQHDEFFTPFQMLMMDMFLILGVSRLDDVLPAVRTLKQSVY